MWRKQAAGTAAADKEITRWWTPEYCEKQEEIKMGAIKIPSADLLKNLRRNREQCAFYKAWQRTLRKVSSWQCKNSSTAPGRTEIIGNHVDHSGGQIIAASIDLDTIGAACPNGTNVIHMVSEGYKQEVVVDLDKLNYREYTKGTDALVAGIMEYMQKKAMQQAVLMLMFPTKVITAAGYQLFRIFWDACLCHYQSFL